MIWKTSWCFPFLYIIISIIALNNFQFNVHASPTYKEFNLVSLHHRSTQPLIYVDNVLNLSDCIQLAIHYKGFSINYKLNNSYSENVGKASRQNFWLQPQLYFNCHVLQCPENATFGTLVSDINFHYYSLYRPSLLVCSDVRNYVCLKEIGLFVIQTQPMDFANATLQCAAASQHYQLADVSTLERTTALSQYMRARNDANEILRSKEAKIFLAYVNLHHTLMKRLNSLVNSRNMQEHNDSSIVQFRAWAPGHPIENTSPYKDRSCIALNARGVWISIDCKRQLPSICEIFP